jgi:hypothetical protein
MTSVSNATAKTVDIKHYIEKYKEHEERHATTNERNAYWKEYVESL